MSIQKLLNIKINNPETQTFLADAYYQNSEKKLPLIVFAHGYKGYKDWGAWDLMAEKFAEAGFYFVKFNFSHNGTTLEHPTQFGDLEAFGNNNFSKEMSDFKTVISHFEKEERVNAENISIIGHSRGGGIAVIEAYEDKRVKNLITFAGVSNFDIRFPRKEKLQQWKEDGVMFSENKRTHQKMPHYFQYYEDYKTNEQRFTIQFAAQNLKKPYLIVQGNEDEAVNEKEALLLHKWCKSSELLMVENGDHTFGAQEPWLGNELPEKMSFIIESTIDFVNKNIKLN